MSESRERMNARLHPQNWYEELIYKKKQHNCKNCSLKKKNYAIPWIFLYVAQFCFKARNALKSF
jgi:hypothetical protein